MENGVVYGESLRRVIDKITKLDKTKNILKSVGVSMYDLQGNVKSTSKVLDELSNKMK